MTRVQNFYCTAGELGRCVILFHIFKCSFELLCSHSSTLPLSNSDACAVINKPEHCECDLALFSFNPKLVWVSVTI